MKTRLLLITACACLLTGISPARADYITTVESTPNLLGYWRFSSASQANSEVNGYTGTFMGHAAVGPANSGPVISGDSTNSAVLLDGTNNTFVNTTLGGQVSTQGSLVGWFYLTALPSTAGRTFYIAGESQNGNDFDLQIDTDNRLRFYTDGGGSSTDPTAFTAADLNQWHFFAATFTANTSRSIYLDGNLVGTSTPGGHSLNPGATFSIGASDVFGGRFFGGRLDEIAIFNRALTATEVANIYAGSSQSGDNIAYMTVFPGGDFGTIDLTTGAFTLLGNSGQTLAGLGVSNSTLYTASLHAAGNLYTVNPADGSLTLVGASGISYDQFGSTGQGLYAVGTDASLYSINSATGAATLVGPTGVAFGSWRNISCNAGALYYANGTSLYTLNTTTGAAVLVGNMGGPQMGAMVLENGILYAGQEAPGAHVDTLDLSSGVATVGPTLTGASNVFGGLAPYPLPAATVPPPGQIFVANAGTGSPGSGTASEYSTSGATINPSLVTGLGSNPEGMATNGRYLFIVDFNGGKIGEYDATTGAAINASLVTGLNGPVGIALSGDGTNLFVTSVGNGDEKIGKYTLGATPGTVSASNPSFVTGLQNPFGIAVSGSNLFVVNSAPATPGAPVGVGEYDANTGAAINATLITVALAPASIAVSGTSLYLGYNHDRVGQYTLGATPGTIASSNPTFVTGLHEPAVALFRGSLFVTDFMSGAASGVIGEYDAATGAAVNPSLVTLTKYPEAIVIAARPLLVTSAVSRKTHGSAGSFDINLPLTGAPGVECRTGGANGDYTFVFTFNGDIASGSPSVTSGTGSIAGSPAFLANTMKVNVTGVTDVQTLTVGLSNVTDNFGQVLPNTAVTVKMLLGDVVGNSTVNASDVGQTKSQAGLSVTSSNFRADVTANGSINASDIGTVKSRSGQTVP